MLLLFLLLVVKVQGLRPNIFCTKILLVLYFLEELLICTFFFFLVLENQLLVCTFFFFFETIIGVYLNILLYTNSL